MEGNKGGEDLPLPASLTAEDSSFDCVLALVVPLILLICLEEDTGGILEGDSDRILVLELVGFAGI
jgi:hypothetical protein